MHLYSLHINGIVILYNIYIAFTQHINFVMGVYSIIGFR